jgi:hypothetical protein
MPSHKPLEDTAMARFENLFGPDQAVIRFGTPLTASLADVKTQSPDDWVMKWPL